MKRVELIYALQMSNTPSIEIVGLYDENSPEIDKFLKLSGLKDYDDGDKWRKTRTETFRVDDDFKAGYVAFLLEERGDFVNEYPLGLNKDKERIAKLLSRVRQIEKSNMDVVSVDWWNEDGIFTLHDEKNQQYIYGCTFKVTLGEKPTHLIEKMEQSSEDLYDLICRTLTEYEESEYDSIEDIASDMYSVLVLVQREWNNITSPEE